MYKCMYCPNLGKLAPADQSGYDTSFTKIVGQSWLELLSKFYLKKIAT